ncbi:MAG TPA: acyl-CoA dehydrogenase family protein [Mycobacteriales bacterium]
MTLTPDRTATHEVTNQAPPLVGHDLADDPVLVAALAREGGAHALDALHAYGRNLGTEQVQTWARQANENPPVLLTHDRYGHRIDEVEFHPAWHELMRLTIGAGLAGAPWADTRPAPHVVRAAGFYLDGQVESGHDCPVSMTYAIVPALRHNAELAARYEPLLVSTTYDAGLRPRTDKVGLVAGMGMTEKQGGSDVRANTTTATDRGDGTYALRGHKWFTSAPMSDVFLMLAQAPGGLSCFLVPRVLDDGTRNVLRLQRLKDKLGNRSNASSEIELDGTVGFLVGPEGRGVRTIIEMVNHTRLDCMIGAAAIQRAALVQAVHHARHRRAFGSLLVDQPAMTSVLADLAIESEAATVLMMRVAGAVDRSAQGDPREAAFKRLATAVGKFWVTKRSTVMVGEALECLGGNGYVEESGLPRLYREAPLNSIWEGSGNVNALDVLRALARDPESWSVVREELGATRGADPAYDAALADLDTRVAMVAGDPGSAAAVARRVVERMALLLQASLLLEHAPPEVADLFCATRLGAEGGMVFGTLPPRGTRAHRTIVERVLPA